MILTVLLADWDTDCNPCVSLLQYGMCTTTTRHWFQIKATVFESYLCGETKSNLQKAKRKLFCSLKDKLNCSRAWITYKTGLKTEIQ